MPGALTIALALAELAGKAIPAGMQLWNAVQETRNALNGAQKEGRDLTADEVRTLMDKLLAPGDELEELGRKAAGEG